MIHLKTISRPPARAYDEEDLTTLLTILTFVSEIIAVFAVALSGKGTTTAT